MLKNSTFLYTYTLSEDQEECEFCDLAVLNPVTDNGFADVCQYLDSLYIEAPEFLVKSILDKI
jgi:hypothetical protein